MTTALDAHQRTILERLVTRARRLLEDDVLDRASGRYGMDLDGTISDEDSLRLDPAALVQRRELVAVVDHLRSEGHAPSEAVGRLLREASFTHLNRLVAIRIAEALGLLPQSLAHGRRSQGFRDVLELLPSLVDDDTGGYWKYLELCGDELAGDVPALFDPRNPLLALAPSPGALDDLVELLAAPEAAELWLASDCLGWVYQFFNTGDERRSMRETSAAPRDSRELAVRNQFFTPRYVVDFLVQNSLGRRLIEANTNSPLLYELPLLVDPPSDPGESLSLDDVSVLDPACGSGHFLLAAYDLLECAWQSAGVVPSVAAPAIVRSLWGIDIDPRCAQVAAAAVIFRARRSCPDGELPRPNIICARSLPGTSTGLDEILATLPDQHRKLITDISDSLSDAPILGPLLKIEEHLATEIRAAAFGGLSQPGTLAELVPTEILQSLEDDVILTLRRVAGATTASAAERLFAAEADDAIRFLNAMQRRYDVVCMNPPFGLSVSEGRPYIQTAYGPAAADLYAAFVARGIELLRPGGYVGAVTNRTGFFLSSLEAWRRQLLDIGIVAFADLGSFVLEGAQVEVAAYVVGKRTQRTTFIRAMLAKDKAAILRQRPQEQVFRVEPEAILRLPGAWFDYWVGDQSLEFFAELEPLQSGPRVVSRGISAGDNFRFLRLSWELRPDAVMRGWKWLSKGGKFSRYYDDVHLLLDWRQGAEPYGDVSGARIFNLELQGEPGVFWPKRTTSLPSARPLPRGTYFEANSIPLLGGDHYVNLAFANSRLFAHLFLMQVGAGDVARGSAAKDWITGPARLIPWAELSDDASGSIKELVSEALMCRLLEAVGLENSPHFRVPDVVRGVVAGKSFREALERSIMATEDREVRCLEIEAELDSFFLDAYGCVPETVATLDRELEPQPASFPPCDADDELFRQAYMTKDAVLVAGDFPSDSRQQARLGKQVELRSLRDLSHLFSASPRSIVDRRRELRLWRSEEVEAAATRYVSYVIGIAMGRWDVAVASETTERASLPDPFDELPPHPPGMTATDRRRIMSPQSGEWSMSGVLVDQSGHRGDIVRAVVQSASDLAQSGESALYEALEALAVGDLRSFLRKRFFRTHLSQYSESRRAAPIYWPLYVPSGTWGAWVYATRLCRETLFAVARLAGERLDNAEAEIRRLRQERDAGGAGRSDRVVVSALESEERLAEELRRFRGEADRIAGLGWDPDLDDGILLCSAPLADIFPAWKDASTARKEIKAGKYPWATVSQWADQL